ncbi:YkgJ family cysteine cluster protein [Rhizosphaericola mali]|uniref:YkgJ family cysteine cluster protein n=1 Tax=Rhizosphaericola mali TaxID=2545455 RepID=A0A5P2G406_9BACT|nr:YkgJ family cysteine cluster protein [Rhizosphaericola mali]QES90566.1 YkgJ family cysteine cluster protein [Rhizosphaericola mali]
MQLQTDLTYLSLESERKIAENERFRTFLSGFELDELDKMVFQINEIIEPKIDCTICGNCCKTLMINVEPSEAERLADHLNMPLEKFDAQYIEKSDHSDRRIVNCIPCHFLSENKCTVYEYRFDGCREFPALHKPMFKKRLFTIFMHYGRCPIIYNVVEQLKAEVSFQ